MLTRVEISYKTVFFIFGFLALLWFLNQVKEILLLLFIAFILMSAFRPVVDRLEKIKIPRVLAIFIVYLLIILFFGTIGSVVIPVIIREITRLIKILPAYFNKAAEFFNFDLKFSATQLAPAASGGVLKFTANLFSNIFSLFSLFVFTFYFLLERNLLKGVLNGFLGREIGNKISEIINKVEKRLGAWVRGQFILCFIVGLLTFIGLTFLKVDYALALAILAGILEIVPNIGPIISAIPAVVIALSTSPILGLATAALYFLIQQLENYLIVPKIMQKVTGFSPIIIILSLMIAGKLMGILGALLAVPMLLVIQVILREIMVVKK